MKKIEEKKTKQKNCMQEIKAWCGEKFRWILSIIVGFLNFRGILSIIVVFLWIGIWCYKEPIFCFLSDDLYKERNTVIIWISIIFIFFLVGIWTWKKNTLFSRASILIIIAFTGLFLVFFREDIFNFFFLDFKNGAQDNLTKDSNNFITLLLSSLIFLTLWFFRTYDVREQIGQQDFHDALRMLADDKLVAQEIAVLRLIDISEKTKVYDDTIKLAFIKRMKAPYETEEVKEVETEIEKYKKDKFIKAEHNLQIKKKLIKVRRRTDAQYIFRWLGERYRVEDKLDLVNLDLSYQDFRARDNKGNKIKHFKDKKGNYFVLDFVNLTGADLRDVNLTEINFSAANLIGSCFIRTVLTKATLGGVQLNFADLSGATLEKADFAKQKFYYSLIKFNTRTSTVLSAIEIIE